MAGIFISYRREETRGDAGRLFDRLKTRFGDEHDLFKDVDSLRPGDDFPSWIRETVPSCRVLIVVIGKHWLSVPDERGRPRLHNPADWVRIEILTALDRSLHIVPVLVGGAPMPAARELPKALARLADRNALEISDASFDEGMNRLIECLDQLLGSGQPTRASSPRSLERSRPESTWLSGESAKLEQPCPGENRLGKDGLLYEWLPPRFEYPLSLPVGKGLWIGSCLVTDKDFRRMTGREAAQGFGLGAPVLLSYSEAREYCQAIGGRLPTGSELDRAPRAPLPPVLMATVPTIWTSDLHARCAYLRAVLEK
jgi:hypothetical protein